MDLAKIILGIAATVIAAYATSSLLLAQKQLIASTRLTAYLTYWQRWILDTGLSKVYALGMVWNQEIRDLLKRGGSPAELAQLETEKKKQLEDVKRELEKIVLDKEAFVRSFRLFPKESVGSILESSKASKQNLIDGKTFISDEEAAAFGMAITQSCINLKMGLLDLIETGTNLIVVIVMAPTEFEIKDYSNEVANLLWKGIVISKEIDSLSRAARAISSKSVLELTRRNLIYGSRLTRR